SFPGIQSIMTLQQFHDAGLDKLTPAQLTALDNAIKNHYDTAVKTVIVEKTKVTQDDFATEQERSLLERFGLPLSLSQDWREEPSLSGTVTRWVGGNSFKMDNGQIWEGTEP